MGHSKRLYEELDGVQEIETVPPSRLNLGPQLPGFVWTASRQEIRELARQFAGADNPFVDPHHLYAAAQRLLDFAKEVQEHCGDQARYYVEKGEQPDNMGLTIVERSTWVYEGKAKMMLDEWAKAKKTIEEKAKKEGDAHQKTSKYLRTNY